MNIIAGVVLLGVVAAFGTPQVQFGLAADRPEIQVYEKMDKVETQKSFSAEQVKCIFHEYEDGSVTYLKADKWDHSNRRPKVFMFVTSLECNSSSFLYGSTVKNRNNDKRPGHTIWDLDNIGQKNGQLTFNEEARYVAVSLIPNRNELVTDASFTVDLTYLEAAGMKSEVSGISFKVIVDFIQN